MYERFTDRARKVMQLANQEAQRFQHEYIGTEHILLGLVKEGSGVAANVLKNLYIDLRKIRLEVEKIVQSGPDMVTMGKLPQTPRAKKVIEYSIEEARNLNHNYVGTEHLLLGLVRESEGIAAQVLLNLGLKLEDVREEVLNLLGGPRESLDIGSGLRPVTPAASATRTPTLDSLGTDLTALARAGTLPLIVERWSETERLLMVLGCGSERNPLLVGPPGVGKASLVWGLARLAVGDSPPEVLRGCRVVQMLLQTILIQSRDDNRKLLRTAQGLADEARKAGNVVLFVEDLFAHSHDSRLFKAVLDAAEVQCIATVTPEAYRAAVIVDPVFAHNFQPVFVEPPATQDVVAILQAHRETQEQHHGVQIADDALVAAAELSERHLAEGCQPARALRLLDQATAMFRLRHAPALPDTSGMDRLIQKCDEAKDNAVAQQDFEQAAIYRDQADTLKKQRAAFVAARSSERSRIAGIVDAATVEQAVTRLTGVQFRGSDAIRPKPEGL